MIHIHFVWLSSWSCIRIVYSTSSGTICTTSIICCITTYAVYCF
nr:MAG TPA: hypothetical protein [Bacteriophage sp.]DAT27342.1 MAG TPA: hypothetical protein [Caudoviricetes sp.]